MGKLFLKASFLCPNGYSSGRRLSGLKSGLKKSSVLSVRRFKS